MLQYLSVQNLALMDAVDLEFDGGFIAVTGETGAGKSILLGALSLLSGSRAEKTIIRQGTDSCEVEATLHFADATRVNAALESMGLPPCEDGVLVLRRVLNRNRAPRVQINGQLATVSNLQDLGEEWIDFHGPGEPQKLFSERWQLELLDLFARNGTEMAAYREGYALWQNLLSEIQELRSSERLSPDEAEFLQLQIDKIDRVEISEEGIEQLERDHARQASAQELIETASGITRALSAEDGVSERLGMLLARARELGDIDTGLLALADRIEAMVIEAEDIAAEYENAAGSCDLDPETAEALEERMEAWLEVRRKYGNDVATVLEKRDQLAEKLSRQGDIDGTIRRLEKEAATKEKALWEQAERIRERRVKAAHDLQNQAGELINRLGFRKAKFVIEIERESRLAEHGNSRCRFQFAPNAGQDLLPLNKIASSGEIARVMLALKAVLAKVDHTPVLVFDEVDANVGGEIARTIGEELSALGKLEHQVFCITHLAQVASLAQSHFVVRKDQTDTATTVTISDLTDTSDARLDELARMLGDRGSDAVRQHASSLLPVR